MPETMTTTAVPAHLREAVARILILAATANAVAGDAETAYSMLNRIYETARTAMATHDDILYPTPEMDDVPEDVAPF